MNKYVAVFIAVFVGLQDVLVTGLNVTVSPEPGEVKLLPRTVSFTCRVDESDTEVKEIVLLRLLKGDKPWGTLRYTSDVSVNVPNAHFTVHGKLYPGIKNSYVQVVTPYTPALSHPDNCILYYVKTEYGKVLQHKIPIKQYEFDIMWESKVYTGERKDNANSNGSLQLFIFGDNGQTSQKKALNLEGNWMKTGVVSSRTFSTRDIGTVKTIRLMFESQDGWMMSEVELLDTARSKRYLFICPCWFDFGKLTEKNLSVSSVDDL